MNGEYLEIYLRCSLNKIYDGRQPFAAQLKIQVEAIQLGIVLSDFFANIDTSRDKEDILKETLGPHYRKKSNGK